MGTTGILYVDSASAACSVVDCLFESNQSTAGGGIALISCAPTTFVSGSVFRGNDATGGGGIFCSQSGLDVRDSSFESNRVTAGGGLYFLATGGTPSLVVRRSVFRDNELHPNAGVGRMGGAIGVHGYDRGGANVLIEDCEMARNALSQVSLVRGGSMVIDGCTLYLPGAGTLCEAESAGSVRITNSILWSPQPAQSVLRTTGAGTVTTTYSNVALGAPGVGNLATDPLFRDPANDDLSLSPLSPCIDAGDPASTSAVRGVTLDLDGDPRLLDGDLDGSLVLDMGADEANAIHLAITPVSPNQLQLSTSGRFALTSIMAAGAPGPGHYFPRGGAAFIDFSQSFVTVPWPSTPSFITIEVPELLALPIQFQQLAFGASGRTFSNPVLVSSTP